MTAIRKPEDPMSTDLTQRANSGAGPTFNPDAILRSMSLAALLAQIGLMDEPQMEDDDQGPFISERDAVHFAERAQRWFKAVEGDPLRDCLLDIRARLEPNAEATAEDGEGLRPNLEMQLCALIDEALERTEGA